MKTHYWRIFVSSELTDFQGKRALVTGAGDGMGRLLALNLGAGLSVVINIRLDRCKRLGCRNANRL